MCLTFALAAQGKLLASHEDLLATCSPSGEVQAALVGLASGRPVSHQRWGSRMGGTLRSVLQKANVVSCENLCEAVKFERPVFLLALECLDLSHQLGPS